MKQLAALLVIIGAVLIGIEIQQSVVANYHWENEYCNYWQLADKSSTILEKQKYISKFVDALEQGEKRGAFASHNAIWLKTPNNSFTANLDALKSLSGRLNEIQKMNPSSFEYNTAIQQITAQEQGEAHAMLAVFQGCFELSSYLIVWGFVGGIIVTVAIILLLAGLTMFFVEMTE